MVSKSQIKLITSLQQKKYRLHHQLFVAEGKKTINELLNSHFELYTLFTTEPFNSNAKDEILITEKELKKISFLKSPNKSLAIFKIPTKTLQIEEELVLALDNIRDPGNLGTIIRLCDWFGVKNLLCSKSSVDCYNPKVIQASMGSITRVNVHYVDLYKFIKDTDLPVFGAYMDGENVYKSNLPNKGVLIMGNEANGISEPIEQLISKRISIPQFGSSQNTESLNVATATAILLSEFKRTSIGK